MNELLLILVVPVVFAAALVAVLNRLWPHAPALPLILIASAILPLGLLLVSGSMVLNRSPDDHGGMVHATALLIGPIIAVLVFAVSAAGANATVHFLRRGKDR